MQYIEAVTGLPDIFPHAIRAVDWIIEELDRDKLHQEAPVLSSTAVFWIITLDEGLVRTRGTAYQEQRAEDEAGQLLLALELARNVATHGQVVANRQAGFSFPVSFPIDFGPWVWKPLDELLSTWHPDRNKGRVELQKSAYAALVSRRLLAEPLVNAMLWIRRAASESA